MRHMLQKSRVGALDLSDQISRAPEWQWANNDANLGLLNTALGQLETQLVADEFLSTFLIQDASTIKASFDQSDICVKLNSFKSLRGAVAELTRVVRVLTTMHKSR